MSNWGDWVPFHRRLVQGRKKAIARGVRFVLLELSLEARPTHGVLEFPTEWDTVKAVHDLIGGDRREIKKALTVFQIPDEFGLPTIEIDRDMSHHSLKIIKWEDYAGPKSSTERSQVSRAKSAAASDIRELPVPSALRPAAATLQAKLTATPTVQDSTEQNRTPHSDAGGGDEPEAQRAEPRPPPKPRQPVRRDGETGFAMFTRVFVELWEARYRTKFIQTTHIGPGGDDMIFQRLGHTALEQPDPERWARWVVKNYLRDMDRWVVENNHPIVGLEKRVNKYGQPKSGAPRSGARPVASQMPAEHPPAILDMAELSRRATAAANLGKATG